MKLSKKRKCELIENWLYEFPCKEYFPKNDSCIHEFITPHEMLEILEGQKLLHDNHMKTAKWKRITPQVKLPKNWGKIR